jgi:hypothetical protein
MQMSKLDKGGWLSSVANAARKAVKAAGQAFKKAARLFAKLITGAVHYPVRAIEVAVRFTIKVIEVSLFVVAAVLVAIVLAVLFVLAATVMVVYKLINGIGLALRSPYDLTRPGGKEGVKTNFAMWAQSWRRSYFTCMTPGDVIRREAELAKKNEYATAWRLIGEATEEMEQVEKMRSIRPATSKKGRHQPSRGKALNLGIA